MKQSDFFKKGISVVITWASFTGVHDPMWGILPSGKANRDTHPYSQNNCHGAECVFPFRLAAGGQEIHLRFMHVMRSATVMCQGGRRAHPPPTWPDSPCGPGR